MPTLTPDQAHFLLHEQYLPGLRNEHNITRKVIEAIPLDKGDYRPDEISKTAIELAWHIVAAEMRFMAVPQAGGFDLSPNPRPESIRNSADLTTWYTLNFEQQMDALTKLSNDQLMKVVDFRGMFQFPAVMYLNFLLHHSVHHRGQLSMYLRPMGATVPSIYGESYDATQARMAAAQGA